MGIKKKLSEISEGDNLRANVACWLLQHGDKQSIISALKDLMYVGCSSGMVSHLIYYSDTTQFYNSFEAEIWELSAEQAESMGYDNTMILIANLKGADDVGSAEQFKNLMAWYAFEETARAIADEVGIPY